MSKIDEKNEKGEKIPDWMFLSNIYNIIYKPSENTPQQKINMIAAVVNIWVKNDLIHQVHEAFKDDN